MGCCALCAFTYSSPESVHGSRAGSHAKKPAPSRSIFTSIHKGKHIYKRGGERIYNFCLPSSRCITGSRPMRARPLPIKRVTDDDAFGAGRLEVSSLAFECSVKKRRVPSASKCFDGRHEEHTIEFHFECQFAVACVMSNAYSTINVFIGLRIY